MSNHFNYKCTYDEICQNKLAKTYGMLISRTKKFKTFMDAVQFSRQIANTNINVIGKPSIDFLEEPHA